MYRAPVRDQDLHASSILIVDDEQANVRLLERILARAGYTGVRTTTSSRAAVQMLADDRPDLVCLDIHMPDLDGFAVLERLRTLSPPADFLPVLAITGDSTPEMRQRVLIAGAKDFLEKPFEAAEVLVRVANLLTTRLLYRSLERQNELLEVKVRERTAELREALAAAEAAGRAKGHFLATMSHELRTPLNAVIGFARHLQKNKGGNLLPQDVEFAQRISDAGVHLLRIIDDILDVSRAEAGKAYVDRAPVRLNDLVATLVDATRSDARVAKKHIAIVASVPDDLAPLHTDGAKLRRVLQNLVANAVTFTQQGEVRIAVTASGQVAHRIDVIDTGIGIPAARLEVIFELFEQAESGTQRRFAGAGLGLSIARTLSELLGFRISAVSTEGVGSAFSILLERGAVAPTGYADVVRQITGEGALARPT